MNIHYFVVMRKDGMISSEKVKPIKVFTDPGSAMDYVCNMADPLNLRTAWELVGEAVGREGEEHYKNDLTHYSTCGRIFEYENSMTGDIREVEYWIEETW